MPDGALCPSCGDLIPAGTARCARCGYQVPGVPTPPAQPPDANPYLSAAPSPHGPATGGGVFIRPPGADAPMWQEAAFRVMAYLLIVEGVLEVIGAIVAFISAHGSDGGSALAHGLIMGLVGVGMLQEWSWASLFVRIMCWVNLIVAVGFAIAGIGFLTGHNPLWGALILGAAVSFGGLYGFLLYLVNMVGVD